MYPIAKKLKSLGNRVVSIIGARTREIVILQEEMAAVSDVQMNRCRLKERLL
jgi:ferredoxin/flavodoxin---NADP+ reductase